jgi:hypothetical protein
MMGTPVMPSSFSLPRGDGGADFCRDKASSLASTPTAVRSCRAVSGRRRPALGSRVKANRFSGTRRGIASKSFPQGMAACAGGASETSVVRRGDTGFLRSGFTFFRWGNRGITVELLTMVDEDAIGAVTVEGDVTTLLCRPSSFFDVVAGIEAAVS